MGTSFHLHLGEGGVVTSVAVKTLLLESSRCLACRPGERNFHIFHQLCVGASLDKKKALQLGVSVGRA